MALFAGVVGAVVAVVKWRSPTNRGGQRPVEPFRFRPAPRILTFRRANGDTGPVTELRFSMPGAHLVLKKQ